jgi:prophage maintenance system killer protein
VIVNGARDEAAAAGDVRLAPPVPLERCSEQLLRSALAAPAAGSGDQDAYPEMPAKAAVLAYALAKAHACFDGNKRLALILSAAFLRLNGFLLNAGPDETNHIFRHVAGSDPADRDDILQLFTHWFAQAANPIGGNGHGR